MTYQNFLFVFSRLANYMAISLLILSLGVVEGAKCMEAAAGLDGERQLSAGVPRTSPLPSDTDDRASFSAAGKAAALLLAHMSAYVVNEELSTMIENPHLRLLFSVMTASSTYIHTLGLPTREAPEESARGSTRCGTWFKQWHTAVEQYVVKTLWGF